MTKQYLNKTFTLLMFATTFIANNLYSSEFSAAEEKYIETLPKDDRVYISGTPEHKEVTAGLTRSLNIWQKEIEGFIKCRAFDAARSAEEGSYADRKYRDRIELCDKTTEYVKCVLNEELKKRRPSYLLISAAETVLGFRALSDKSTGARAGAGTS